MTYEIMREKAEMKAREYAYGEYCAEFPETIYRPKDIMFEPTAIKVEGYDAWKVRHSDVVFVFDDVQIYPMQRVKQVYEFVR